MGTPCWADNGHGYKCHLGAGHTGVHVHMTPGGEELIWGSPVERRSFDRSKRVYVVKSQTYAVTESATDWETGEPRELRLPIGLPHYQVTQPQPFGPDIVRDYGHDVVGAREHAWAHNAELGD